MSWNFYENRYGKSEFHKKSNNHSGYYRYNIKIFNPDLIKKLQLEGRLHTFHFYNLLPFEEVEALFDVYWVQESNSISDINGKIHVCGLQKYEELLFKLYKLLMRKLSIEWGYIVGEDYEIDELGYIRIEFMNDFYKNYWLINN